MRRARGRSKNTDRTSVDDDGLPDKPGLVVDGIDALLAEVRDASNPTEWRAHALLELERALLRARETGQTHFTFTATRADGQRVQFITDAPELLALALIWTPTPNRAARRAARRQRRADAARN